MEDKKEQIIPFIILSAGLAMASYYIENYFNLVFGTMLNAFNVGISEISYTSIEKALVTNLRGFDYIPVLSFWLVLGIVAYFAFLIIADVYYEVNNYFVVKFSFIHGKEDNVEEEHERIKLITRLFVHAGIASITVISVAVFTLLLLPMSELIRNLVQEFFTRYKPTNVTPAALGFIASFVFWYCVVWLTNTIYVKLKTIEIDARIAQLHEEII